MEAIIDCFPNDITIVSKHKITDIEYWVLVY